MPSLVPTSWADVVAIIGEALRLVYPPSCAVCHEPPAWSSAPLCSACLATLSPRIEAGEPPRLFLGHHLGPLRTVVTRMKRGLQCEPAVQLAGLLGRLVRNAFGDADGLVAVPPSADRIGWRDFDPARLVASEVARASGLPLCDGTALVKIRKTRKQAYLSQDERFTNVAGAFRASTELRCRQVVLIDDVLTTGATLTACCEAVEAAGGKIFGAAFLSRRPSFVHSAGAARDAQLRGRSPESSG